MNGLDAADEISVVELDCEEDGRDEVVDDGEAGQVDHFDVDRRGAGGGKEIHSEKVCSFEVLAYTQVSIKFQS